MQTDASGQQNRCCGSGASVCSEYVPAFGVVPEEEHARILLEKGERLMLDRILRFVSVGGEPRRRDVSTFYDTVETFVVCMRNIHDAECESRLQRWISDQRGAEFDLPGLQESARELGQFLRRADTRISNLQQKRLECGGMEDRSHLSVASIVAEVLWEDLRAIEFLQEDEIEEGVAPECCDLGVSG